eukprot:Hpha_TRINITY_DN16222_c1_g3::TRINITY_DN16222_c1_g3_i1::g.11253::m.11253
MGNCTSSEEIKGQAPNVQKVQATRPVQRQLQAAFDEKKGGVKKVVRELPDEAEEELHRTVPQIAAPEEVENAAAVPEEAEIVHYKGIAALRSISPSRRGLSLLYTAGETRAEPAVEEAVGDAQDEPVLTMREEPEVFVDAVDAEEAPKESFARELVVDTGAEPQAEETSPRELECESPSSPLSPAAWVPDASTKTCQCCGSTFTFARRRHHCRECGHVVCNGCSTGRKVMPQLGHSNPVRCCNTCVEAEP